MQDSGDVRADLNPNFIAQRQGPTGNRNAVMARSICSMAAPCSNSLPAFLDHEGQHARREEARPVIDHDDGLSHGLAK